MDEGRRQHRIILCGTSGTGKTTEEMKLMNIYPPKGKTSLAVLPDDLEPAFFKIPEIGKNQLSNASLLRTGIHKIFYYKGIFTDILKNVQNGILTLDDARNFSKSRDEDLLTVFRRSRQNNLDIVFACHGLSEIPPSLLTYTTRLVLFQTTDSWQRLKQNIPNPLLFEEIVNDINKRANDHKDKCPAVYWRDGKIVRNERGSVISTDSVCLCGAAYTRRIINPKTDLI